MDSIADLFGNRTPQEPDEINAIKNYISKEFNAPATVAVQGNSLIISVQSAALANTLRLRLPTLKKISNTTKRLVLRIG